MPKAPTLSAVLLTALTITLCSCSKQADEAAIPNNEKTVLSSGQQNALDKAKLIEKTLQNDMEMREQKMRDEGI